MKKAPYLELYMIVGDILEKNQKSFLTFLGLGMIHRNNSRKRKIPVFLEKWEKYQQILLSVY